MHACGPGAGASVGSGAMVGTVVGVVVGAVVVEAVDAAVGAPVAGGAGPVATSEQSAAVVSSEAEKVPPALGPEDRRSLICPQARALEW